ncbi:hypothetical protein YC2023_018176 [Brassica napus]
MGGGERGILDSECSLSLVLKTFAHRPRVITRTSILLGKLHPEAGSPCCCAPSFPIQPDLPTEEGSESDTDGFIPYVPRTKKASSKPCKDKQPMVDEDVVDGQLSPDNILKDYLDSGPSEVLEFAKAARMVNGGLLMINRSLNTSKQEADMARFKAEVADKEIARLKDELESSRRREGESFEKEVNHAYRRGKREVVELPDYSYDGEYARQTVRLPEKDKNFAIPEVEEKIWEQWDLVPVSPDTVEAETGDLGETGEVNQLVASLDVNDYSIGRSMSGNFDLGD